jgi:aldehyde dehydrogenase (NAD+)
MTCLRTYSTSQLNSGNSLAASSKDIDLAVAAARQAFKTTWGKNVTGVQRSKLIHKLADLIERDAQELAELESLNNGKPVKIARCGPCISHYV